jgi:serine/threonine protein phosphatase PrpC
MAAAPQDEVTPRVKLEAWLVTDVGVVRDHNEDSAFMEISKGFFIVADGMGGHAAGEVASAMAVETVRATLETARPEIDEFRKAPTDTGRRQLVQLLQNAVLSAHQAVYQRGQSEQDKAGMGTTLDVVLVAGPEAFVAHVGDSRTYLIREGRSSQITTDHTVAEVLVIEGKLTIEEAQVSPLRTILVNAIGVSADVGVEMAHVTLKRGDRILLCSDGLHDYFPIEEEIAQKLSAEAPGKALKEMVELAKTRGGHDNITGIAIHVVEISETLPVVMEGTPTQPLEAEANPFADEPTETAFVTPPGLPPRMTPAPQPSSPALKSTQPMRVMHGSGPAEDPLKDIGDRPTDPRMVIPPPDVIDVRGLAGRIEPAPLPPAPPIGAAAAPAAVAEANTEPSPAPTAVAEPAPADPATADPATADPATASDGASATAAPSTDDVTTLPDGASAAGEPEAGIPTEIEIADTGRVNAPKDKGAS